MEINEKENTLVAYADNEFKLGQLRDVLTGRLAKRGVDIRALESVSIETIGGDKIKETIRVREGIDQQRARTIVGLIKDSGLEVQAAIQGDAVRVTGPKKDELQQAIALVRRAVNDFPLRFKNFRD